MQALEFVKVWMQQLLVVGAVLEVLLHDEVALAVAVV